MHTYFLYFGTVAIYLGFSSIHVQKHLNLTITMTNQSNWRLVQYSSTHCYPWWGRSHCEAHYFSSRNPWDLWWVATLTSSLQEVTSSAKLPTNGSYTSALLNTVESGCCCCSLATSWEKCVRNSVLSNYCDALKLDRIFSLNYLLHSQIIFSLFMLFTILKIFI